MKTKNINAFTIYVCSIEITFKKWTDFQPTNHTHNPNKCIITIKSKYLTISVIIIKFLKWQVVWRQLKLEEFITIITFAVRELNYPKNIKYLKSNSVIKKSYDDSLVTLNIQTTKKEKLVNNLDLRQIVTILSNSWKLYLNIYFSTKKRRKSTSFWYVIHPILNAIEIFSQIKLNKTFNILN